MCVYTLQHAHVGKLIDLVLYALNQSTSYQTNDHHHYQKPKLGAKLK